MSSDLTKTAEKAVKYADIFYKGFIKTPETVYSTLESNIFTPSNVINSTSMYPFDDAHVSLNDATSIRVRLDWSVFSGSLYIRFFTGEQTKTLLTNFNILTQEPTMTHLDLRLDLPKGATFLRFENPTSSTCSLLNVNITGIQKSSITDSIFLVRGVEAIKNSIKLFLFSARGDYGRKVLLGGPLDFILGKPVTELTTSLIEKTIRDAIASFYTLDIADLTIIPDPEKMKYSITMYLSDEYNKYVAPLEFTIQ